MRQLFYLFVLSVLLTTGCRRAGSPVDDGHKAMVDSVLRELGDADSLAAALARADSCGDRVTAMLACKHLGKYYRDHSQFDEATRTVERGLRLADELADTIELVRALNNQGTNYRRMGVTDEAIACHFKALELSERFSDTVSTAARKNRVVSLNGIGNILLTLECYNVADSVLRMALQGERALGSALGQAINLANLGYIKQHAGDLDSASFYYRRSLQLNREAGSNVGVGLCYIYMGKICELQGRPELALADYEKAYTLLEDEHDRWHWLEACQAIAGVLIDRGEPHRALPYVLRCDTVSREIQSLEHIAATLGLQYRMALKRGDTAGALDYYTRQQAIEDSIYNTKTMNLVQTLRIDRLRHHHRHELDRVHLHHAAEEQVHTLLLWAGCIIVLLLAGLTGFLYYNIRLRAWADHLIAMSDNDPSMPGAGDNMSDADKQFLHRLSSLIGQQFDRGDDCRTDTEYLASRLNLTASKLRRKVLTLTGENVQRLVARLRIDRACRLLEDQGLLVSDVAYRCGCGDVAYFSRLFKQRMGVSPSQYRNRGDAG